MKIVTAAIIIEDDNILITLRNSDSKLSGYWEFPGGKMEGDETPQECLERELGEELGVKSKPTKIITESEYHYSHGSFKLIAIQTSLHSNNFVLTAHDEARWIPIAQLLDYKLAPADIPIANYIVNNMNTSPD